FEVELDDLKRFIPSAVFETTVKRQIGLTHDIFDQCKLVDGPAWTENLRKWFNPQWDPMKNCNRSYVPWTELRADGRVWM
ncbi:hypothetical protein PENTCL1PPCAC_3425, partial [Pristionchus entomophagus]